MTNLKKKVKEYSMSYQKRISACAAAVIILVSLLSGKLMAQTAEVESVKATINTLFDGMRTSDSTMVGSVFSKEAIMQTVAHDSTGKVIVRNGSLSQFKKAVAGAEKGVLDERISNYQVHIDGSLATVWTPYEFYLNGNFSHCGVNSFEMVKTGEAWKIVYIIDTRRKEGCN